MINPTIASTAINQSGLDALGSASGQLAARWAEDTPAYDPAAMTLSLTGSAQWHAMMGGLFQWHAFGASGLTDAAGESLTGVVGVFRFHPQAALRLHRLIGARFDGRTDGRAGRPVPVCAAIRDGDPPAEIGSMTEADPPLAPQNATVGTSLSTGTLTFHDELGLIIDPIAVACLLRDLMRAFPALRNDGAGPESDLEASGAAGGIGTVAALATGRRVHIVDLFLGSWQDRSAAAGLRIGSGARLDAGPHDWPNGQSVNISGTAGDVRFGFSPEGALATTSLAPPTFPATTVPAGSDAPVLDREFFRIIAVDLGLHLKGNRTADDIDGVAGVDAATVLEPAPSVRDGSTVDLLIDGQTTLGGVTEVLGRTGLRLAVSSIMATDVAFPANRGDRWPARPAPAGVPQSLDAERSQRARSDVTAAYVGTTGPDIVLTWPSGSLPAEAHVRAFPRVDPGPAIVPLSELDFARRGDGADGVATSAGLTLLLKDPYRVGTGTPPVNPKVRFDLLIVTREGSVTGRLIGGLEVNVATGGTAPSQPTVTNLLDGVPLDQRGIAPAPVLGIPPTAPASGTDPVLAALGEAAPREAPRFRTMARKETIVVGDDNTTPGTWHGVLTAGFLNARSMRGDARLGNPGNPAGPEDHAPGVRVTGPLAADLARHALRRTHHLSTRLAELDNSRWVEPSAGSDNMAGAVLRNVAQTVEAPELEVLPESLVHSLPDNWAGLISAIQSLLPASMSPLSGAVPAPGAGDRWVDEVRRETFATKHGRRDSQWSWRWALSHARKFVYLETPLFGATAAGSEDHEVDLIEVLHSRLTDAPDLRVVIATPKHIPFGPGYESIAHRFYLARNEAFGRLQLTAPKRVAIYHPVGFPGRPEVIHGTVGIVDDVWMLLGSSAFSRRGLTFDGSVDVVFVDKTISRGVSNAIHDFRRLTMARTLGLVPPPLGETANANWVRLAQQTSAFELIREIAGRGGDGLIEPLWSGLPEAELPAMDRAIADPDGRGFSTVLGPFATFLAGLGQDRV